MNDAQEPDQLEGQPSAHRAFLGIRRRLPMACLLVVLGLGGLAALPVGWIVIHGVSARDSPTKLEEIMARTLRHVAIPATLRHQKNPISPTSEFVNEGMAHWADHCASCHGNDGRGNTEIGQHLYPKVPDMTLSKTQGLSDGELFAIIKNGVRLTGMPAWGSSGNSGDSQTWELVLFIRHLQGLSPADLDHMKSMNPISPMQQEQQRKEDDFLSGGDDPATTTSPQHQPHPGASRKELP